MTRADTIETTPTPAQPAQAPPIDKTVCPFCGAVNLRHTDEAGDEISAPCPKCTMADTPATRQATKARIGPWFVRQVRNPSAPGMKFDTLMALVKRGQVTASSVVRGPTTHQLWRFAANVKGLSREFGVCYSCGGNIDRSANLCPHCNRLQDPPMNPDVLLENPDRPPAPQAGVERGVPAQREMPAAGPTVRKEPAAPEAPVSAPSESAIAAAADPETALHAPPPSEAEETYEPPSTQFFKPLQSAPPPMSAPPGAVPSERSESKAPVLSERSESKGRPQLPARRDPPRVPRGDGLLTAQELAAAFQLELAPSATRGGPWQPPQQQGPLAPPPPRREASTMRLRNLVTAAVVVTILGLGALLIINQDYREKFIAWSKEKMTGTKQWVSGMVEKPQPRIGPTIIRGGPSNATTRASSIAPPPIATLGSKPIENSIMTAPLPAPPPKPTVQVVNVSPPQTAPVNPAPAPTPAVAPVTPKPQIEVAVTPPPKVEIPKPAPKVEPKVEPKVVEPQPSTEDQAAQARTLWWKALDAESQNNYKDAVDLFEQIKKLPSDVWPGGIEYHLAEAKKHVK